MARAKKVNSARKSNKRKAKAEVEKLEGKHARQLAPERAVKTFINERIATKNATSEAGQTMSTATKRFADAGGNVPAGTIATRFVSKAKQDPLKARVLLEDVLYYLECMDFDRLAPKGLFTAEESGQRRGKQPELPIDPMQAQAEAEPEPMVTH